MKTTIVLKFRCPECGWTGKNPIEEFCRVCAAVVEPLEEYPITIKELEELEKEITTDQDTSSNNDEDSYTIKPIYYLE